MTGDAVHTLLKDASAFLRFEAPGPISLDDRLVPGYGTTREGVLSRGGRTDRDRLFVIGTAGLKGNHDELSNYEAMKPIVAFFHEICGHGGQLKYEFTKKTPLSTVLALNHYACKSSKAYYFGNASENTFSEGFSKQISEIAAQYMGLKCAQSFMNEYFKDELEKDPDFVDRMLLDYVNGRQRNHSEHIQRAGGTKDFDNVEQVFNEFNSRFQACVNVHHEYKPVKGDPVLACCKDRDYDIGGGKISILDRMFLSKCQSGAHQDIMMCAASRHGDRDPDVRMDFSYPAFDGIDLDLSSAFSRDGPGIVTEFEPSPMAKMKDMVEASLADGNIVTRTLPRGPDEPDL